MPSASDDRWRIPGYPESAGTTPESRAADRAALSDINAAAWLAVMSFVVSSLALGVTPAFTYLADVEARASTAGDATGLGILIGTLVFAVALALVQLGLFRRSFRTVARYDPVFANPGKFALVAMVGLVVVGVLAIVLVILLFLASSCTSGNPWNFSHGPCSHAGVLLLMLGLLLVAVAVAAIGYIGVVIGVWRAGSHFGVELFKPAAILLVLVAIVGALLLLVAVRSARRRPDLAAGSDSFL